MRFSTRAFNRKDAAVVSALVRRVLREDLAVHYAKDIVTAQIERYSPQNLSAGRVKRWVAIKANSIVATCGLDGREIVGLFVSKRFRNNGIGSGLLEIAEKKGFETHKTLFVQAALGSQRFYYNRGYRNAKKVVLTCKGLEFNAIRMTKRKARA